MQKILFILGCQRSGTTLMTRIFDRDLDAKVYGEFSDLTSRGHKKIRLNEFDQVKETIEGNRAGLIVLKPLVESQNCLELLSYFRNSKALWMFRNYKDVISSNLNRFGLKNGINDIRPIYSAEKNNWRSEKVSEKTRQIIRTYYEESMNPYEAAALFWYSRNILYFDQNLNRNEKVFLCKYEDVVSNPDQILKEIYRFIGREDPRWYLPVGIHKRSLNKGKNIQLNKSITELCNNLQERLTYLYHNR